MDYAVSWSPEALADVDDIASCIVRDSAFYAQGVVSKIVENARNLKNFPLVGRIVPELDNDHIRERFIYSYRMICRVDGQRILIVAVIHGRRLHATIDDRLKDKKRNFKTGNMHVPSPLNASASAVGLARESHRIVC